MSVTTWNDDCVMAPGVFWLAQYLGQYFVDPYVLLGLIRLKGIYHIVFRHYEFYEEVDFGRHALNFCLKIHRT